MKRPAQNYARRPDARWMKTLNLGDVIARPNGPWRIVRALSRRPDGTLHSLTVTINHCSWTGRCYTILMRSDLFTYSYRKVRVKTRRLDTDFDKKIATAIMGDERPGHYTVTCCDVEGIP
jgi:hypothetical protein